MRRTRIVGILNLAPDSFSEDGTPHLPQALKRLEAMLRDGADVIDLGAESTRPGAVPISSETEWQRLSPVLKEARKRFPDALLSIDSYHADTASRSLAEGADWINDVTGFSDEAMCEAVRDFPAKLVMMHSLGVPPRKTETLPEEVDIVACMIDFAQKRRALMESRGIEAWRMIFDPGIGFGKTARQSMVLIEQMEVIRERLGMPVLAGHSRKSFLHLLTDAQPAERDEVTRIISKQLIAQGVDYLRVHDVAGHAALVRHG